MKILISFVVLLLAVVIYLCYSVINQAITIDHLQMSVASMDEREECLLRVSRSFTSAIPDSELRQWIKTNLADLDIHEEETRMIVNQVDFDFSKPTTRIE